YALPGRRAACGNPHRGSGAEQIPDAAYRHEPLRPRGIALDLPAQVHDVHVARALVAEVARVPEMLDELSPREDALRSVREQCEQPKLRLRQLDRPPLDGELLARQVELEIANDECRVLRRALDVSAAQDRADAAHELRAREGLRDVVVRAGIEP